MYKIIILYVCICRIKFFILVKLVLGKCFVIWICFKLCRNINFYIIYMYVCNIFFLIFCIIIIIRRKKGRVKYKKYCFYKDGKLNDF